MTEYTTIQKNTERKVKDLLQYLYKRLQFRTFRDIQPKSEPLAELDKAIQMLDQRHSLKVDRNRLQSERARLLGKELELTETQVRELRGLTLVEGTWAISLGDGALTLSRDFVDNVPNSPRCEVRLSTSDISNRDLEIIRQLPKKEMRLSVFGNALAGITETSRTVLLKPVAIY